MLHHGAPLWSWTAFRHLKQYCMSFLCSIGIHRLRILAFWCFCVHTPYSYAYQAGIVPAWELVLALCVPHIGYQCQQLCTCMCRLKESKRVIFHGSGCLHSSLSLGSMWKKPSSTTSIYNRLPLLRPLHQVCQFITNFCGAMWHVCHVANFDSSFDRGSHILPHQCWSPKCSSRRLIDCWFFAASLACVCFQRPSTPLPAPQPLPDGYYACTWVNWQPMYTNVELWCWQVLVLSKLESSTHHYTSM